MIGPNTRFRFVAVLSSERREMIDIVPMHYVGVEVEHFWRSLRSAPPRATRAIAFRSPPRARCAVLRMSTGSSSSRLAA